jgi:hypothetical protein
MPDPRPGTSAYGLVRYGRPAPDGAALELEASPRAAVPTHTWTWAALMCRAFDLDALACSRRGGRLLVLAPVQDPLAVQARPPSPLRRPRAARSRHRSPAAGRPDRLQ